MNEMCQVILFTLGLMIVFALFFIFTFCMLELINDIIKFWRRMHGRR